MRNSYERIGDGRRCYLCSGYRSSRSSRLSSTHGRRHRKFPGTSTSNQINVQIPDSSASELDKLNLEQVKYAHLLSMYCLSVRSNLHAVVCKQMAAFLYRPNSPNRNHFLFFVRNRIHRIPTFVGAVEDFPANDTASFVTEMVPGIITLNFRPHEVDSIAALDTTKHTQT